MISKEKSKNSRRKFIKSIGFGVVAIGLNTDKIFADSENKTKYKVLTEKDSIDIGDKGNEIIQKAYELGYQYEGQYKGCARCTVAALQDAIDFIPVNEELFRAASCLDGGATPTKLANCGSFTGSGMLIGWACGTDRFGDNSLSHKLIHKVHARFEEEFGSVICKEIREKTGGKCPEVVGNAAKWATEIVLRQFTNYK